MRSQRRSVHVYGVHRSGEGGDWASKPNVNAKEEHETCVSSPSPCLHKAHGFRYIPYVVLKPVFVGTRHTVVKRKWRVVIFGHGSPFSTNITGTVKVENLKICIEF